MSQDKKIESKKTDKTVKSSANATEVKAMTTKKDTKNHSIPANVDSKDEQKVSEKNAKVAQLMNKEIFAKVFLYCIWVVIAFYGVQLVISLLMYVLPEFSLQPMVSLELESFMMSSIIFASTIAVLIAVPALVLKLPARGRITGILGLRQGLPMWRDIGLAIAAYVACFAAAIGLTIAVQLLFPSFNINQAQSLPFDQNQFYAGLSLVWIYLTLGVAAPIGEELIFRGYLFGRIRRFLPASITIVITAIIFSMLHVIGFSDDGSFQAQWNVVVGILPLAIGLGILREYTGSVWASIILHSLQNTISFVLLFMVLPTQGMF